MTNATTTTTTPAPAPASTVFMSYDGEHELCACAAHLHHLRRAAETSDGGAIYDAGEDIGGCDYCGCPWD